ncbi:MAG: CinA family nicotinamide mononucleotide deamidase-related protein [Mucinivorans sp.]
MQNATIITIGDELLIGQVIDTNSAWIGQRLGAIGVQVLQRIAIGDVNTQIIDTITTSLAASDVVIVTGGLGPTKDDITKAALCSLFDCSMVRHEAVFAHVARLMAERGIDFNALNQSQADVPYGFTVLPNTLGTAPGLMRECGRSLLFCLPGVPFEMKELLDKEVLPAIASHFALSSVLHSTMLVFGLPESELASRIAEWEDALPDFLHLAYLPNPSGIRLRLSAYGVDREEVSQMMAAQFEALQKLIPDYIVGPWPTSLEAAVASMLVEGRATLSAAESCTGGVIASRFTAMAGASEYFKGGVVAYDNSVKINTLGVPSDTLAEHGAVSKEVVEAMAEGVRRVMATDYAIATSGIAGPTGGSALKAVGTVWVAVASKEGVSSWVKNFGQPRSVCIDRASCAALNALRLILLGVEPGKL